MSLPKCLKWLNDYHWYIIAACFVGGLLFWTYGCESKCNSLLYPEKLIGRVELQNELSYFVGLAKAREANLDRQDAAKQALLDAANIIGSTGQINPSGLLTLASTIGAISFGLNRNQVAKNAVKTNTTNTG